MAKKNQKQKKRQGGKGKGKPAKAAATSGTGETRAADTLTIGWMLATLATTIALGLGLAVLLARRVAALHETTNFLTGLMLLIAVASGLVTLALTWPVLRVRRVRPPRAITIYAVAIGVAPLVVVALLQLAG